METTGLKADSAEIVELAAVLVEPDGSVTSEFSVLVRTLHPVPAEITRLTGITQAEVDTQGQPIGHALAAFLGHIGERPVFFHNAPFDQGFLSAACANTKLKFKNAVYDTLPVAQRAWPSSAHTRSVSWRSTSASLRPGIEPLKMPARHSRCY